MTDNALYALRDAIGDSSRPFSWYLTVALALEARGYTVVDAAELARLRAVRERAESLAVSANGTDAGWGARYVLYGEAIDGR